MAAGIIQIQVRSDLLYEVEAGPQSDADLLRIAEAFSERINSAFAERLRISPRTRVTQVRVGPVSTVIHSGILSFETAEQWDNARILIESFSNNIEEIIAIRWRRYQGTLEDVHVAIGAPHQITPRHATNIPQNTAAAPPSQPVVSEADFAKRERELLWRNFWITGALFTAVALVAAAAWWNVSFLRQEVSLLRDEIRTRATESNSTPMAPTVITCPPAQVRVVQAPQAQTRTRVYSSRP